MGRKRFRILEDFLIALDEKVLVVRDPIASLRDRKTYEKHPVTRGRAHEMAQYEDSFLRQFPRYPRNAKAGIVFKGDTIRKGLETILKIHERFSVNPETGWVTYDCLSFVFKKNHVLISLYGNEVFLCSRTKENAELFVKKYRRHTNRLLEVDDRTY